MAIYVGWVEKESGFIIGTTRSPRDVPRDFAKYNKYPTHVVLIWTAGQEIADRILGILKEEIRPFLVRRGGVWYNKLPHESAIISLREIAARLNVWLASTDERNKMLADACDRAVRAVNQEQRQLKVIEGNAKLVPFERGR